MIFVHRFDSLYRYPVNVKTVVLPTGKGFFVCDYPAIRLLRDAVYPVMVVVLVRHKYEVCGHVIAFALIRVNENYAPVVCGKAV